MTWWRGTRRYNGVALIVLASLVVVGIALPILISMAPHSLLVGSNRVSAAPHNSFVVTTPIALGIGGLVTIENGTLYPADSAGRALQVPMSAAQITSGKGRFMIEDGELRIQTGQQTVTGDTQPAIIDALSALQFDTLMMRNTSVRVQLPDGRTETISDIDGEVTNRRKSSLAVKGKGTLRGQAIEFDATSGVPTDARPGATIPFKLAVKSALLDATLDGRAGFVGPAQLRGTIDFSIPQIRQVARWFGADWPAGPGLQNVTGRGQFDWAGPAMAFNRATFHIDGNEAHGTLNLKFLDARPSVGGTLAFKSFDLSKYFPAPPIATGTPAVSAWKNFLSRDLSLPLLRHFDADIRLSADKVLLNTTLLGRSAVTVTIARGRMLADIGAVEFDGGRASGQISTDMSGPTSKFSVRGKVEDIDASRATMNLFGHPVLTGRAVVTTDLSLTGKAAEEFLVSSSGRLNVTIRNGGKLGLDLTGLTSAVQKRSVDGWGSYGRNQMAFDELDASFIVKSGILIADDVQAKSGDIISRMKGSIEIPTSKLNLLVQQGPAEDIPTAALRADRARSVEISGQWNAPTIRNETVPDRAAAPSPLPGPLTGPVPGDVEIKAAATPARL